MSYRDTISATIDKYSAELKELGQWVYDHPETAMQEVETSKKLASYLRDHGFEVQENVADTPCSFVATKKNGNGQRVCLMPEYDALPGIGHACGHHLIATSTIAAGLALAACLDEGLEGEVTLVGAPAEETGEGKPPLVDAGIYNGFDAAMSWHPSCRHIVKPKWISIGGIDFEFTGKPAHAGSFPDEGVNALDALVLFYNGFSVLRQQLKDGSRIHGIVMEGGSAANIIPDRSKIRLEFRSPDPNYYYEIEKKVIKCAEGAAMATGCTVEYHNFEPTCCGVLANDTLADEYTATLASFGITPHNTEFLGSTDVGNVSTVVPTIHPHYAVIDIEAGLHTHEFLEGTATDEAYENTFTGSKVLACTLLRVLEDADFAASLKR
ncbi:MAG: M20 family metallopeptidase [Firmicutes bacterium]|nr:M20 family metallopeptidase [Bacillota bacterium]